MNGAQVLQRTNALPAMGRTCLGGVASHQMLDFLARHLISLHHLLGHLTAKDIKEGG